MAKNKFDFTQGEWETRKNFNNFIDVKNELHTPIARTFFVECSELTATANARLISCAPEMLMALIENCYNTRSKKQLEINKTLIERATGKKWSEIN